MAIAYTDNFSFPLLADAIENWGAVFNGIITKMDRELYKAQHPLINRHGNIMVSVNQRTVIKRQYNPLI
jgi:hypothetical protein